MWADYSDVTDRWVSGVIPADESQVMQLLADAEDSILKNFPDIQTRIDNGTLPIERVQKVAAWMVIRHLRNPELRRSTSDSAGPFQRSITHGGENPGLMAMTDEEKSELSGPQSLRGKAFGFNMAPNMMPQYDDDLWRLLWRQ